MKRFPLFAAATAAGAVAGLAQVTHADVKAHALSDVGGSEIGPG